IRLPLAIVCALLPWWGPTVGAQQNAPSSGYADVLQWSQLADLPAPHGLGGPIAGMHKSTLVVAGGANFPDGRPWDGASKVWHDRIYILQNESSNWQELTERLPQPLAYAVSVSTPQGIAVVGGNNERGPVNTAYLLQIKN